MMDRNSLSGTLVSSFCRICTTNNDVDWSIYETLNEDEGTTNLHMMLVKLYPTVFNESQVLCDEALKWPTKICKECKAKVIESYKFYERCTKSARSLRTIASKEQPTTDTLQEEKDDHPAVIKMEFIECEEPIVPKEECDSDDHSSTYKRFYRSSPTEDVFSDTEDSRPAPTSIQSSSSSANKMEQIQSTKQNANLKGKGHDMLEVINVRYASPPIESQIERNKRLSNRRAALRRWRLRFGDYEEPTSSSKIIVEPGVCANVSSVRNYSQRGFLPACGGSLSKKI
ncbi:uncharacterized protein LOC131259539 isoform X3 [Anopheles coustani]|uniref:uncharacterized protein LOC131259539 isoform X3 n=1 Tax=Anopheles coustani TaxID=139045 RepID=UPI002658DBD8|nr:uncharacterized protein LOC131259539 isoform X3 [Anopheles coustani]